MSTAAKAVVGAAVGVFGLAAAAPLHSCNAESTEATQAERVSMVNSAPPVGETDGLPIFIDDVGGASSGIVRGGANDFAVRNSGLPLLLAAEWCERGAEWRRWRRGRSKSSVLGEGVVAWWRWCERGLRFCRGCEVVASPLISSIGLADWIPVAIASTI